MAARAPRVPGAQKSPSIQQDAGKHRTLSTGTHRYPIPRQSHQRHPGQSASGNSPFRQRSTHKQSTGCPDAEQKLIILPKSESLSGQKEKIFKLIIIFLFVIMTLNILQVFSYATNPNNNINIAAAEASTQPKPPASAEAETSEEDDVEKDSIMGIIKTTIGQWYYVFRYFSIIAMLLVLIFLGIKLAITTIAEDKAKYKRMLVDWVVGFVIIFVIMLEQEVL